jgi:hypothetical protein
MISLIAETIGEYYPIGHSTRPTSNKELPGFKKIGMLMNSEFLDKKAYKSKWGKLTSDLEKALQKSIYSYPDLGGGGFLGEIPISEEKQSDFIRKKSLCFYISVLGPFFSIQGIDSSIAILPIESRSGGMHSGNFAATHAVTVSPIFEYLEVFNQLEDELRSHFPGYLFVPYNVGMSTMKFISIADELRNAQTMDTVYEGLFGRSAVHDCLTRGDERYGMSDWLTPFSDKEKELMEIVSQHILWAPADTTVHKVWKLQESKRLETFTRTGNLMFGMDRFDLIDLTDKKKAIITSGERRAPSESDYNIKNGEIDLSSMFSFRIVELSENRLIVNLILNVEVEDTSIKGETEEMTFIAMKKL